MNDKVIFYTIHCAKCRTLQMLMDKKQINYEIIDDTDSVLNTAKQYNITSAPFAIINDEIYDTKQLQIWINKKV